MNTTKLNEKVNKLEHELASCIKKRDELKFAPGSTKVGVMAVILHENSLVLLGKKARAVSPEFVGKWVCPGGRVNYGEKLEDAVRRECDEEINAGVTVLDFLSVHEIVEKQFHFVFPAYICRIANEVQPCPGDDVAELIWAFPSEVLADGFPATPITKAAVSEAVKRGYLVIDFIKP